jgi:hypothetical protein
MKIAFRFENGTSQLILTPDNGRDKQYLDLCMDGKQEIRLKPTTMDCTIIEFVESKPRSVVPTVVEEPHGDDNPGEPSLLGRADEEIA